MKYCYFINLSLISFFLLVANGAKAQISISFSHERGFYDESFDLFVNTSGYNVSVKYTLDGSEPSNTNGISPVDVNTFIIPDISRTTVVRLLAFNMEEEVQKAHTYIFVDDIFTQTNNSTINELNYPPIWGYGKYFGGAACKRQNADYEMTIDTCLTNTNNYQQKLLDGLMEIPTMAISLNKNQIFGADSGIYVFPLEKSDSCYTLPQNVNSWERKASIEIFNDIQGTDTLELQVNAGLQMSGASTRYFDFYKHSFRLKFRSEYGASKLKYPMYGDESTDKFESLQLRMVGHSSPNDPNASRRSETQYHKDGWVRDLQRELSGYGTSANSKFFHLFINGLYWGIYDVTERPDADFMSEYNGDEPEDYDVIKINELKSGTDSVYKYMYDLGGNIYDTVSNVPVVNANRAINFYNETKNILDIDKFIDYSLLNLYFVNLDWVENNWWAARNAKQNGKFQFFVWDAEFTLNYVKGNHSTVLVAGNQTNALKYHPIYLNQRLLDVPEYKIKFGDHIQCNCIEEDGVLNSQNLIQSYKAAENNIHNAKLLEFARWGDVRKFELNYDPLCYDVVEQTMQKYETEIFPNLLNYMAKIYGTIKNEFKIFPKYVRAQTQNGIATFTDFFHYKAAKFSQLGGEVPVGYQLELTNPNTHYNSSNQLVPHGDIYYTTDGSDPRNIDGTISSTAVKYTESILIDEYKLIKARVFTEKLTYIDQFQRNVYNVWSTMCPRQFWPVDYYTDMVINEIHYNPSNIGTVSGSNLEFLEIKNIGNNELNLSNTKFTEGIRYQFPLGTKVPSNGYILLASDSIAVKNHYNVDVDGQYFGKLANGGELITLAKPDGAEINAVEYDDAPPWNVRPDGTGSSLSLYLSNTDKENNHLAESWGSSAAGSTPKSENIFCLPMTLNLSTFKPSCLNGNDGFIILDITGGSEPYNIEWVNNGNGNIIDNLTTGTYEVSVTDDQNCLQTQSVTLEDPDPIISNLEITHATSINNNDGYATINPANVDLGYTVFWSDGSSGNTINNLAPGNNYWVTITDNRNNSCSITESFTVEVASPCATPYNFTVISTSEQSVTISWSANADNTNYLASYRVVGDTNWSTVNTSIPSLSLNNLNVCTAYEYKLNADCNAITSNSSIVENFTTAGCTNVCNGNDVTGNTINITDFSAFILWDIIPNATYRLNYRKNGVSNWNQYNTHLNFSILFGLDNCSNYEWYIDVICPNGVISSNMVNNFTTTGCLRKNNELEIVKEELTSDFDFNLYPNPAQNFINISSKNSQQIEESKILIYDFSGRFIMEGGMFTTQTTVNIEVLQPGMYVMQVVNKSFNLQYRFKKE